MTDPQQLLREYVESSSETAFRQLVDQYVNLVYSVALRRTDHDTRIAEDIVQTVFMDLARKATDLPTGVMLGGWLHRHTCFVASNVVRSEQRRVAREQQALEMNMLHDDSDEGWKQLAPVLDDAIQELAPPERDAIVLRFFEQRDFRSVGAALGVSDDTAPKRVSRALEKLRGLLVQRGITMGVTALGTALADRSLHAAPGELGSRVAGSIEYSPNPTAAMRTLKTTKWTAITAVVALLLVVILHPDVADNLRSWFHADDVSSDSKNPGSIVELQEAISVETSPNASRPTNEGNGDTQEETTSSSTSANVLRLTILADDSGKPVPNVPLEVRYRVGERWRTPKLMANRFGICDVPLVENISELRITTQIGGFADTRLDWNIDRGQSIPLDYTVKLIRPVQIGGRVVDPNGQPVTGAKVGFNHREDPLPRASVESHNFSSIETTTDSEGRWRINRIAPGMIRRIYGSAKHPEFISTPLTNLEGHPEIEAEMRSETHMFQLGRAVGIRGLVQDPEGNPIAFAKVRCGEIAMSGTRETKTFEDGTFGLKGLAPGKTVLSAEAPGFAATTIPIEITRDAQSFTITLHAGKELRIRVIDASGKPVPQARLHLDTMTQNLPSNERKTPLVQVGFAKRTDQDGRIIWENAPDQELRFDVSASGYMRKTGIKVRPGEQEHVITLDPALVVTGRVRDAQTGKDIPRFRVICGWPGQDQPVWSSFDRNWLVFEGGTFKHSFEAPLLWTTANPGYVLRIEAEGYSSAVSRDIAPTEGTVHLDFVLKPANTPVISVYLPDGRPAAFADVGFVSPDARLGMIPGGFSRRSLQNGASLSQTDKDGQFRLMRDDSMTHVIIAHPEGCVEITPADLINHPEVRLQPWGRLEGTYHSGVKPVEGREFVLEFGFADADAIAYSFSKRVKTDKEGRFVFPQLLPGTHKIMMLAYQKIDKTGTFTHNEVAEVEIISGQTTTVELGGNGYTVRAQFLFPHGIQREGMHIMASIHTPFPVPPENIRQDQNALQQWIDSPAIQHFKKQMKRFNFQEQPDGSWAADNVIPGKYQVMIHGVGERTGNTADTWFGGAENITVPSEPATGTLDIGTITLKPTPNQQQ